MKNTMKQQQHILCRKLDAMAEAVKSKDTLEVLDILNWVSQYGSCLHFTFLAAADRMIGEVLSYDTKSQKTRKVLFSVAHLNPERYVMKPLHMGEADFIAMVFSMQGGTPVSVELVA